MVVNGLSTFRFGAKRLACQPHMWGSRSIRMCWYRSLGGVFATVLGVVVGAMLARRAQIAQWSRDRQVEALCSILRESTKAQIGLLQLYRQEAWRARVGAVE